MLMIPFRSKGLKQAQNDLTYRENKGENFHKFHKIGAKEAPRNSANKKLLFINVTFAT